MVPGNLDLGTTDFCVMQFEAKGNSSSVYSNPTGSIYVSEKGFYIYHRCKNNISADTKSGYNASNFRAITNPEWMTIARNIENIGSNWSGGSVGSGCLFRGNSGETTGDCGYRKTSLDIRAVSSRTGTNNRGRLRLSNGANIWDFAGNADEWVDWEDSEDNKYTLSDTQGCETGTYELSTNCLGLLDDDFRPAGNYTSTHGAGNLTTNAGSKGARRGGHKTSGDSAGIYSLTFKDTNFSSYNYVGFRCVYHL